MHCPRPKRKPKIDHRKGMGHKKLLGYIVRHSEKFEIPPYIRLHRERKYEKNGLQIRPDLVFYHEDGLVTIVEAKTSPYSKAEDSATDQLRRAKKYFENEGYKVRALEVYMRRGEPKHKTPMEFIFEELEKQKS